SYRPRRRIRGIPAWAVVDSATQSPEFRLPVPSSRARNGAMRPASHSLVRFVPGSLQVRPLAAPTKSPDSSSPCAQLAGIARVPDPTLQSVRKTSLLWPETTCDRRPVATQTAPACGCAPRTATQHTLPTQKPRLAPYSLLAR